MVPVLLVASYSSACQSKISELAIDTKTTE